MVRIRWARWRRDLLVGLVGAVLAVMLLTPFSWAALRQRARAESARDLALEAARQAEQKEGRAREQASRNLVDQAAQVAMNFGADLGDGGRAEGELLHVTTAAVTPEVPKGAYLLIDKKTRAYAAGDIVLYRVGGNNYLGRVVAVGPAGGLTVGRNGEADRRLALEDVVGRCVLNSR